MHYYQHHIGDFIKDTSFLTNEEIGIYMKLIWIYYDTEEPLKNDIQNLCIKVSARDNEQGVANILKMFFKLDNEAWTHTRCDSVIKDYHLQISNASKAGKASALKRTMVQQPLNKSTTTEQLTNNHKPITINHLIDVVKTTKAKRLDKDFILPADWILFCRTERKDLSPESVFAQFKDYWIAQGGQKGAKLDWFATWRNWVRNQKKENIKTIDPPKPVRWFDTIEGIHKKGEEMGISTDGCLTIGQYEEKIRKAGG